MFLITTSYLPNGNPPSGEALHTAFKQISSLQRQQNKDSFQKGSHIHVLYTPCISM